MLRQQESQFRTLLPGARARRGVHAGKPKQEATRGCGVASVVLSASILAATILSRLGGCVGAATPRVSRACESGDLAWRCPAAISAIQISASAPAVRAPRGVRGVSLRARPSHCATGLVKCGRGRLLHLRDITDRRRCSPPDQPHSHESWPRPGYSRGCRANSSGTRWAGSSTKPWGAWRNCRAPTR